MIARGRSTAKNDTIKAFSQKRRQLRQPLLLTLGISIFSALGLSFAVSNSASAGTVSDASGSDLTSSNGVAASNHNAFLDATLSKLERKWFMHDYPAEGDEERVRRLEKFCYGDAKSGALVSRIKDLASTAAASGAASDRSATAAAESEASKSKIAKQTGQGDGTAGNATNKTHQFGNDDEYSKYPRVRELEEQLLGKTFEDESVQDRLTRLEKKAFGMPSRSDDLSERVDKLSSFAHIADKSPDEEFWNSTADYLTSLLSPSAGSASFPNLALRKPPYPNRGAGLVARVSNLEMSVFGKVQSGTLFERIAQLETKMAIPKTDTPGDLPSRVDRLALAINGAGLAKNGSDLMSKALLPEQSPLESSSVDSLDEIDRALVERLRQLDALVRIQRGLAPSASSMPYLGPPYSSSSGSFNAPLSSIPVDPNNADPNATAQVPATKHGFLHGLGKVVTKAGGLVLDTMAGPNIAPGSIYGSGYPVGLGPGYGSMYSGFGSFAMPGAFMTRGPFGTLY